MNEFVFQPVAHVQGNRMMDAGKLVYGPLFSTRYQATKWMTLNWYTETSTSVKRVQIFHKAEDAHGLTPRSR